MGPLTEEMYNVAIERYEWNKLQGRFSDCAPFFNGSTVLCSKIFTFKSSIHSYFMRMPPKGNTEFLYTRIVFIAVRNINGDQVVGHNIFQGII